jgi:NAD(P)-dependent dehydrogenase (short-subunit alcohol dehydrogenase family)
MNPIHDFKGHVGLVTGASSGIGLATAKAFAEARAAVTAHSRNAPHSTIPGASR